MTSLSTFYCTSSFLNARDPSIIAGNIPGFENLKNVRLNLENELKNEPSYLQPEEATAETTNTLPIYLRIKKIENFPNDLYQIQSNSIISKMRQTRRDNMKCSKKYEFTSIFPSETTQTTIFNSIIKPKLLSFINGQNMTLLSYGASGSGKTFTIIGTTKEPGIIPRALEYLFSTIKILPEYPRIKPLPDGTVIELNQRDSMQEKRLLYQLISRLDAEKNEQIKNYKVIQQRLSTEPIAELTAHKNLTTSIWISFAEIYNEHIYDLFESFHTTRPKTRTKLRLGNANGIIFIKNLININVTTSLEAYKLLQYGLDNLNYASTSVNRHSSRSHSIFTIRLVQKNLENSAKSSKYFNFCDLAGSERLKKTQNIGDRLKESNNINTSLLVLGRCIQMITDNSRKRTNQLIPYRESKLTELFQKALSGQEKITMIVNISTDVNMFDETQHTLNFSAVAKEIVLDDKHDQLIRHPIVKNRFSMYLKTKSPRKQDDDDIEEDDVNTLRGIIVSLQEEIEILKAESETDEMMIKNQLMKLHNKVMLEKDEACEKKIEIYKRMHEREMKQKIDELMERYRMKSDENEGDSVITIVSDGEDEAEDEAETEVEGQAVVEGQAEVEGQGEVEVQAEIKIDELKTADLEKELMKKQLDDYKTEIIELKKTLEDARICYENLEKNYNDVCQKVKYSEIENIQLRDELFNLQEMKDCLCENNASLQERVLELENQLNPITSTTDSIIPNLNYLFESEETDESQMDIFKKPL